MSQQYIVEAPDGSRHVIEGPDPTQTAQPQAQQPQPGTVAAGAGTRGGTVLDNMADMGSAGIAPRAAALMGAGLSHVLPGPVQSYSQALADIQSRQAQESANNPLSADLGKVMGVAAFPAGKVAALPEAVGGAAKVANVARLAAAGARQGAVAGGISGAVQGSDNGLSGAVQGGAWGAGLGAVTGGVLAPAAAAIPAIAGKAIGAFGGMDSKVGSFLAKKFGLARNELSDAIDSYRLDTGGVLDPDTREVTGGRLPALSELADLHARGKLAEMASDYPQIGSELSELNTQRASTLPQDLRTVVEDKLGMQPEVASLISDRNAQTDAAMDAIRHQQVPLSPDEISFVQGSVRKATGKLGPVNAQIANELDHNYLSIDSVDAIRRKLNDLNFSKPGTGINDVSDQFATLMKGKNAAYDAAVQNHAALSREIDGFQHGLTGKTTGQTSDPGMIAALATPEGVQGYQRGLANRLSKDANASESGAASTAKALSQNAQLSQQVRNTYGQAGAELTTHAAALNRARASLSAIAPNQIRPEAELNAPQAVLSAASALHGGFGTAIYHSIRALPGLHMSDAAQKLAASYLTDPSMAPKGVALMVKSGARMADIQQMMQSIGRVGAAAGGQSAGRSM